MKILKAWEDEVMQINFFKKIGETMKKKNFASIFVVMFTLLALIIIVSIASISLSQTRITRQNNSSSQSYQLAQSGIENAIAQYNKSPNNLQPQRYYQSTGTTESMARPVDSTKSSQGYYETYFDSTPISENPPPLSLTAGDTPTAATIDSTGKYAYFGISSSTSPKIIRINLSNLTLAGSINLNSGDSPSSAVIDPSNNFAYFGISVPVGSSGKIDKVDLSNFTSAGLTTLPIISGENILTPAVIEPNGANVYFGAYTTPYANPGKIIKLNLSNFTNTGFTSLNLNSTDKLASSGVIDSNFAYFGTDSGEIFRINLSDFTRKDMVSNLDPSEKNFDSAIIDPVNSLAYFVTNTSPAKIVKIDLSSFKKVSALNLAETPAVSGGDIFIKASVIDTSTQIAYFAQRASSATGGKLAEVNLATFSEITPALNLASGENHINVAVIDQTNHIVYFGNYVTLNPGLIIKVQLAKLKEPITVNGFAPWNGPGGFLQSVLHANYNPGTKTFTISQ